MKVIYLLTGSVSSYRAVLPADWDVRTDASYPAAQAARLAGGMRRLQIESWRPEIELPAHSSYVDDHGVRHRAFPSVRRFGLESSPSLINALKDEVQRERLIVEVHGLYGSLVAYEAPRVAGFPIIGQSHGWKPADPAEGSTWKRKLLAAGIARHWARTRAMAPEVRRGRMERGVLTRYDHVFVANEGEAGTYARLYPTTSVSIRPFPADFDLFKPVDATQARRRLRLAPGERVILFAGRLEVAKGVQYLIDALPRIARVHSNCRLVIIGDGGLEPELHRQAEALGCAERVTFVGWREQAELPRWFSAADVFVTPSLSEASSLVAREAMACGTPVVATDVGGSREITEHFECGLIVPPRDSIAIAAATQTVLRRPDAFRPNIERGRAAFGWEAFAAERLRTYEELCARWDGRDGDGRRDVPRRGDVERRVHTIVVRDEA